MEKAPNGRNKVFCKLVGEDGNAFAIMGRATAAMRKAGWTIEERHEYQKKATSGDYDNLLRVTMDYTYDFDSYEEDE